MQAQPTVAVKAPSVRQPGGLQDLTPQQWKSGIAAWLGWLFDGLDMHLYTLVAAPFVMQLLLANSEFFANQYGWAYLLAAPFVIGDDVEGSVVVFEDISERQAQAREIERDLERLTLQFAAELRRLAAHASTIGEDTFGDLRTILDEALTRICPLYTPDAADDLLCVDLGGRRIIKKKKKYQQHSCQSLTHCDV